MMPKTPVDECPAGPEMDAAVAETLGYEVEWSEQPDGSKTPIYLAGEVASRSDGWTQRPHWRIILSYSIDIDIAAAWELIEKLKNEYKLLAELMDWPKGWFVVFSHAPIKYSAIAETAPLAICRAFLKAKRIEYIEVSE